MAGRRPLPDAIKKLRGNPGKRKPTNNERDLAAIDGVPEMPDDLPELAQKEWKSIVPQLQLLGVLKAVDGKALAAYCYCFARWMQAEKEVERLGILVETSVVDEESGEVIHTQIKRNPAIAVIEKALMTMKAFLIEFGLTPASRSRLKIEAPKGPDAMDAFLAGDNAPARVN